MNKLKVFTESHQFTATRKKLIEITVNQWLKDNTNIKVITTNMTAPDLHSITYSILYNEINDNELIKLDNIKLDYPNSDDSELLDLNLCDDDGILDLTLDDSLITLDDEDLDRTFNDGNW